MRKVIILLIGIMGACAPVKKHQLVSITLTDVGLECTLYEDENGERFYRTGNEIFFSLLVENTSDQTIYFGAYNNRYDESGPKYGIFEMNIFNHQITLDSKHRSCFELKPGESNIYSLIYKADIIQEFSVANIEATNNAKLLEIFNGLRITYLPLIEDYVKEPYPEEELSVNTDSFFISYGPWDSDKGMWLLYDRNGIDGSDIYLKEVDIEVRK